MNAPPPKSFPPDCHPASRVTKIKQRATSSKFTPPSNCQLSLRFYGEASSTIPATPYDDLRRGEKGRDRDSLPKGNLLFVVIARISARAFPIRPLFEAGTKALACEISQRPRANTLSVTLRPSPREKDTFSREKLLSNAITICYGAVTAKRLNDDRHRCAYMLRTRACMCVYASLMRGEERKIERRKESGRSIDIDQLAGIGPRMRELIKPNH